VPALQVLDSVQNGTVEMGHTANYYYIGKDPTWALFCATPFGLNARQQNAWFYDGEGTKLIDDFGKKFNVHCLSAGNTGCQMGGWFNKELKEPADLAGLKMRIGGWAGVPQRRISLVAGCRIHLRHLHDPLSHAEVNAHPGGRLRPDPDLVLSENHIRTMRFIIRTVTFA